MEDIVAYGLYRRGIYLKNLTLGVVKLFLMALEIQDALKINLISYQLKLSIFGGYRAGPNGLLGSPVT